MAILPEGITGDRLYPLRLPAAPRVDISLLAARLPEPLVGMPDQNEISLHLRFLVLPDGVRGFRRQVAIQIFRGRSVAQIKTGAAQLQGAVDRMAMQISQVILAEYQDSDRLSAVKSGRSSAPPVMRMGWDTDARCHGID
jgi:hypothetical protein